MNVESLKLDDCPAGVEFPVKVVPGASRDRIAGVLGDALKVAVAAPPEAGKANAAIIDLLTSALRIRRQTVQIVSGHAQPRKRIRVAGLDATQVRQRLSLQDG